PPAPKLETHSASRSSLSFKCHSVAIDASNVSSRRTPGGSDEGVDAVQVDVERHELLADDRADRIIRLTRAQVAALCGGPLDHALERESRTIAALDRELARQCGLEVSRSGDGAEPALLADQDVGRLEAELELARETVFDQEWEAVFRLFAVGLVLEPGADVERQRARLLLTRNARLENLGGRWGAEARQPRQDRQAARDAGRAYHGSRRPARHGFVTETSCATSLVVDSVRTTP